MEKCQTNNLKKKQKKNHFQRRALLGTSILNNLMNASDFDIHPDETQKSRTARDNMQLFNECLGLLAQTFLLSASL